MSLQLLQTTCIISDKVFPTRRNAHVFGITTLKYNRTSLIKCPKSNPVFRVQRVFAHRDDISGSRSQRRLVRAELSIIFIFWNSNRPKPRALFRDHRLVLFKQN